MNKEKVKSHLGDFEELVMLAIQREDKNAYGVSIRETLEQATQRHISAGALYTTLDRLEEARLIISWLGDPTPERGGRAKKFFKLRETGEEALRRTEEARRLLAAPRSHLA